MGPSCRNGACPNFFEAVITCGSGVRARWAFQKVGDGRGEVFLCFANRGFALFWYDASGRLAPARLTAFENLRQPAAEHPAASSNLASSDFYQRLDGSILPLSTGLVSSGVVRSQFLAPLLANDANSRYDDRIRGEGPSGSSNTCLKAPGMPRAVRAITLVLMASVFAMPGNIPRACFLAC